jgi:hypothetical protein
MKLSKEDLKKIIVKEMKNMIDEEALIDPSSITYIGTGTISTGHSKSHHDKNHHKSSSYMAKPQLEKIAEYAQKLHDMICHGEQLDDWMESHIAQMADDVAEVYHALSYNKKHHK